MSVKMMTVIGVLFFVACPKPDKEAGNNKNRVKIMATWNKKGTAWQGFDKLTKEQKYEAASKWVENRLKQAEAAKDVQDWTRCLVQWSQLRIALHGYETAVRFLMSQKWPADPVARAILDLYYTHTLLSYADAYSWEINKREQVVTTKTIDLKHWTRQQIFAQALKALERVWKHRDVLGNYPVNALTDYIRPNDYPKGIRPTLRDALTYLIVRVLANTENWTPAQSNNVWALDVKGLLGKQGGALLSDTKLHPLKRLVYVLDDLEQWHGSKGEKQAAFEARLERLRRLHDAFTETFQRKLIRDDLAKRLPGMQKYPWVSMGYYQLAEFVQDTKQPDALIMAHALAKQGYNLFPNSIGGERCRYLLKEIEYPKMEMQSMATDAPGKRSLEIEYKNIRKVYFRAYAYDLDKLLKTPREQLIPCKRSINKMVQGAKLVAEWSMDLPETRDFRKHRVFVTPPLKKLGLYVVIASAHRSFESGNNILHAQPLVLSHLMLVETPLDKEMKVTVLSAETGRPVKGARVEGYQYNWRNRGFEHTEFITNARGEVVLPYRHRSARFMLIARKNGDVTYDLQRWYSTRSRASSSHKAVIFYTDRGIYRPGQKLLWKAILYKGNQQKGNFHTLPNTEITILLKDANGKTVISKKVQTNRFGTASGAFRIPATGHLLGMWSLQSSVSGAMGIRVEQYKRPTFEVKLDTPAGPVRLNHKVELSGQARYYFGLPVASGNVVWRVVRRPRYPWWWSFWGWIPSNSRQQTIAAGNSKLDEQGKFSIHFMPTASEHGDKDTIYTYEVQADVTNEGGETRKGSVTFNVGFTAVNADIVMSDNFVMAKKDSRIQVLRQDLNGKPAPGKGSWQLFRLREPKKALLPADLPVVLPPGSKKAFHTPGDLIRPRWDTRYDPMAVIRQWKDGKQVSKGSVVHDAKGQALITLPGLNSGVYRLKYETIDPFGKTCTVQREFLVVDRGLQPSVAGMLQVEKASVPVGNKARLFVASGFRGQHMSLKFYRDGKLFKRMDLVAGHTPALIEIPVKEADRGGFGVTLTLVRDHQALQFHKQVFVPWDNHKLKIQFTTFRDKLRPGQKEHWTVHVTGPAGKDKAVASAELLAYMYDRSLDLFRSNEPFDIASIFPTHTGVVTDIFNLGTAGALCLYYTGMGRIPGFRSLKEARLKFYNGYGIGGPGIRGYGGVRVMSAAPMPKMARHLEKSKAAPRLLRAAWTGDKGAPAKAIDEEEIRTEKATPKTKIRKNFAETAFFLPHLITDQQGNAAIDFTVPDSVTSWNIWVNAITNDLSYGVVKKQAKTVKELMVRPYVPRFFREGDVADLKVMVNNSTDHEIDGLLDISITDPDTGKDLLAAFGLDHYKAKNRVVKVQPGRGVTKTYTLHVPPGLRVVAVKSVVKAGTFSDGELRPVPVLPGRIHLAQSRFVTLRGPGRRVMTFDDMKKADPTRINEKLVVTLDAQLFYSVLSALPYLVKYPYECTEQTLNRFICTGIMTSFMDQYPALKTMVEKMAKRNTRLEQWDQPDPNRRMELEETPWLNEAQGGEKDPNKLINILNPKIAKAQRKAALARLRKLQLRNGAFPWFPGGPPSPYMTLYLVYGFSKALEFGVTVPKSMIQKAWSYLHEHYLDDVAHHCMAMDTCWEFVTFLNYTISQYPDASWTNNVFTDSERQSMLDFSFKHWKQHSPYLKGMLALTLHRMSRDKDARLVWDSVMDSARTKPDMGTFWAPEDRAWLWYNDTIETHAFALRTLLELDPKNPKTDGIVLWLFLNKKLNHWHSTRATAEVIYSLAKYLKQTGQLAVKEDAHVEIGPIQRSFQFNPDEYSGKHNHIVLPGDKIDPKTMSTVVVSKQEKGYLFASATWQFSTEKLPKQAKGDFLSVTRRFYKRVKTAKEIKLLPIDDKTILHIGDEVEVQLSITTKHPMEYVHLRDPRGAGFEPISLVSGYKWDLGLVYYDEVRDSGENFFFEYLPQGEYTFHYRIRVAMAGIFRIAPATIQPMYAPEFNAYSKGMVLRVKQ